MDFLALGPLWTNSHLAALAAMEQLSAQRGPFRVRFEKDNASVLERVAYRKTYGIVAVGNNIAGLVYGVVTSFWSQQHDGVGVYVIGEMRRRVEHQLLVRSSIGDLKDLQWLVSHRHAFPQCEQTLRRLGIGHLRRIEVGSTSEAARMVASDGKMRRAAAIATREAGAAHGLYTLRHNIEDSPRNATRFHILGTKPADPTGKDRTALILKMPRHLHDGRRVRHLIEDRSSDRAIVRRISEDESPTSVFYCEASGHRKTKAGAATLRALRSMGSVLVLGSYPRGTD